MDELKRDPIEIECRNCGALPKEKCWDSHIGVYEHTFHNIRISDAAERWIWQDGEWQAAATRITKGGE